MFAIRGFSKPSGGRRHVGSRQVGAQGRSGLAPRSLVQDEPHAHRSETVGRQTVANEVGTALLVVESAGKQFRSHLDDEAKLTDVEVASGSAADLDVSYASRTGPRFFGTIHRLGDEVGKESGETAQFIIRHILRVHDIDQRHDVILSAEWPACGRVHRNFRSRRSHGAAQAAGRPVGVALSVRPRRPGYA